MIDSNNKKIIIYYNILQSVHLFLPGVIEPSAREVEGQQFMTPSILQRTRSKQSSVGQPTSFNQSIRQISDARSNPSVMLVSNPSLTLSNPSLEPGMPLDMSKVSVKGHFFCQMALVFYA